jgi:hypothetical protein
MHSPSSAPSRPSARAALPWAWALSLAAGCLDGGKPDSGSADTAADTGASSAPLLDPTLDECVPVAGESQAGVISMMMEHGGELLTPFLAPADRLSGLLTFALVSPRSDDDLVTLGLTLEHPDLSTFEIELDVGEGQDVVLAGVAAPGEVLVMGLAEWGRGLPGPEEPYVAEASWTWTEYDDCYEPNNTAAEARHVPTGAEHSAWMVSMLGESEEPVDWYRFTIAEDSVVTLSMVFPETIPMWVELFAGDRSEEDRLLTSSFSEIPGEYTWSSDGPLPAGTYTLRFAPFVSLAVYDTPLYSEAPHMYERYTFRVDASPAR